MILKIKKNKTNKWHKHVTTCYCSFCAVMHVQSHACMNLCFTYKYLGSIAYIGRIVYCVQHTLGGSNSKHWVNDAGVILVEITRGELLDSLPISLISITRPLVETRQLPSCRHCWFSPPSRSCITTAQPAFCPVHSRTFPFSLDVIMKYPLSRCSMLHSWLSEGGWFLG